MSDFKSSTITNIDLIIKGRVWDYAFEIKLETEPGMFRHEVRLYPDTMGFEIKLWPLNAAGYHSFEKHVADSSLWINGSEAENKLPYDIWDLMGRGDPKSMKS